MLFWTWPGEQIVIDSQRLMESCLIVIEWESIFKPSFYSGIDFNIKYLHFHSLFTVFSTVMSKLWTFAFTILSTAVSNF